MTVRSFIREHPSRWCLCLSIGYEKVIEGRTYVREMAGKPKQKESLWTIITMARRIKRVFGKVHINFGEPLALGDFLETNRPGWASESSNSGDWSREAASRRYGTSQTPERSRRDQSG